MIIFYQSGDNPANNHIIRDLNGLIIEVRRQIILEEDVTQDLQLYVAIAAVVIALVLWCINSVMYIVAARKLILPQTSDEAATSDAAEQIRVMVRHENDLVNHRLTWMLTMEGFMFAAIGFAWEKLPTSELVFLFALIGIVTAGSASVVLDAAHFAIMDLGSWWDKHKPKYNGPDVLGFRGHHWILGLFAPWRVIPPVLVVAWFLLFLLKAGLL